MDLRATPENLTLTQRLGIQYPIIQAPMVGVSTPALAAAVSNAGALGSIGLGASNVSQAKALIAETRALTCKPFNVNLFCHCTPEPDKALQSDWLKYLQPLFTEFDVPAPTTLNEIYTSFLDDPDMLELLLVERPAVVSFHFGLPPTSWIDALKRAGIVLLATATDSYEAELIERAGLDAIIAQGVEAGGHRGVFNPQQDALTGTLALVRTLSRQCSIPIIAAGGIMDGQSISAMLTLGAQGAQLGTAFILCPETAANPRYRADLKSPKAAHTRITSAISGRPARGMVNRLITDLDATGAPQCPAYPLTYDAAKALHAAASAKGCNEFAVQWAGQGAALAREMSAKAMVEVLVAEMN
ncbi:2-nitropropane dioxygenase [Pseudomonas frederiksbergensis]|uniref:Nitronate monooxygenase n=1 Tax=Pseudomonas frederiksbergensis TaxID=104087 RepID=A0A1J0ENF2_9PSED|nr:nitronate monooxygenase [Pseudomonas frederiksbergensis]APC17658.1 2-nitropropane dioxygenase [Pseudomonas frederiksbergensis]